jgi:hypothetical protein
MILLSNWPLSFSEVAILINISVAYAEREEINNSITILEGVYSALKQSYMEEQQRSVLQCTIANNLSKAYGMVLNHERAIEIACEGIDLCKKFKLGNALPYLLYSVAWNKERLIDMGMLSSDYRKECIAIFKQAYFIASAMQLSLVGELIKEHITKTYDIPTTIFID